MRLGIWKKSMRTICANKYCHYWGPALQTEAFFNIFYVFLHLGMKFELYRGKWGFSSSGATFSKMMNYTLKPFFNFPTCCKCCLGGAGKLLKWLKMIKSLEYYFSLLHPLLSEIRPSLHRQTLKCIKCPVTTQQQKHHHKVSCMGLPSIVTCIKFLPSFYSPHGS